MFIIYDHIAQVMSILSVHITDVIGLSAWENHRFINYMLSFGCPAEDIRRFIACPFQALFVRHRALTRLNSDLTTYLTYLFHHSMLI